MPFTHHNYRISPELENSRLTKHCPVSQALRNGPETPEHSRSLEEHSREPRLSGFTSLRPSPWLELGVWRAPGASLQGTWRATAPGSRHGPASWAAECCLGPIVKVPLRKGAPGAPEFSKRDKTLHAGVPPAGEAPPLRHLSASVPDQSCLPRPPPRRCRPRPPPAPPPSSRSGSPPPPPAPPRLRRRQRDRARFHTSRARIRTPWKARLGHRTLLPS